MAQARPPITPISHGRRHERSESVQAVRGDLTAPRGHNMPTPLTRFIGREREVATIGALLETNPASHADGLRRLRQNTPCASPSALRVR